MAWRRRRARRRSCSRHNYRSLLADLARCLPGRHQRRTKWQTRRWIGFAHWTSTAAIERRSRRHASVRRSRIRLRRLSRWPLWRRHWRGLWLHRESMSRRLLPSLLTGRCTRTARKRLRATRARLRRSFASRNAWRWRLTVFLFHRRWHKWRNIFLRRRRYRGFRLRRFSHRFLRPASPPRIVVTEGRGARQALPVRSTRRRRRPLDSIRRHSERRVRDQPQQNSSCNCSCNFHRNSPSPMNAGRLSALSSVTHSPTLNPPAFSNQYSN